MKNVRASARFWIGGVMAALAGVALARLLAPELPAGMPRVVATLGGQLLALAGLGLICVGVSRRIKRDGASGVPREPAT